MEPDRKTLLALRERYDSFYLYDEGEIIRRTETLKRAFPSAQFLYSVKANPHPLVLKTVLSQGFGVDAASPAEARMGADCGLSLEKIHFSAPGKTERGIEAALPHATLVADSVGEVERIGRIAQCQNRTVEIGIRIHPDFPKGGEPSKFGVDEAQVFQSIPRWKALPGIRITGIHVHWKSQILDRSLLERYYESVFSLAGRVSDALGRPLDFVNVGSGIGIPYAGGEASLDLSALGGTVERLWEVFRQRFPGTKLLLETGRYVVGPSGVYVSKVLDKKVSCGKTFVLLCNTLNGFLRPSLARLIEGAADDPAPCEPLYTGKNAIQVYSLSQRQERETVTLAGNLCTAADVAARDLSLPRMEAGDLVVFPNAGSYAAVLSPMQFSSQTPPAELFRTRTGEVVEPHR